MSQFFAPTYRTEAGVNNNPATSSSVNTHCNGLKKSFREVFIHWNGAAWVEDPVYLPGQSVVALRVNNICDDTFSYINYGYNDFRLLQLCCRILTCGNLNWSFTTIEGGSLIIKKNGSFVVESSDTETGSFSIEIGDEIEIVVSGTQTNFLLVENSTPETMTDEENEDPITYTFTVENCLNFTVTAEVAEAGNEQFSDQFSDQFA